ncbi:MAG TPA: adenylate/guanylate cyclase domain-containing protein [Gaiellaceae bacterium]|nr:adenylate/guanylate cyclase domain-containing protein [Gaiellaceae bacterium]
MTCPSCGSENGPGARYCASCGRALGRPCPGCGASTEPGHAFCPACGTPLAALGGRGEERRAVTVVFVDLVGFTSRASHLDPEDVRALQAPYLARVRTELERFGGTVEKFIGDAAMAVFGAPVAHEDDPERAVRAGLAILEAVAALNEADPGLGLAVRVGVNTGEALVALDARPEEGEVLASGDVVNTAARIEAAASPGTVLVGESTVAATRGAIAYEPHEPVAAKGKDEPVPVRRALRVARSPGGREPSRDAPLVGRDAERALLLDAVERIREGGRTELVTLVGVPGIGKSRLVFELLAELEGSPDAHVLVGRSLPYGEGVTFWALAEMVQALAGIDGTDGPESASAKLEAAVARLVHEAGDARWIVGHLRPLVGIADDDGRGGGGADTRAEAFAAWRRLFEALAESRPTVLAFEDLHWADDGLLDFVDHLVEWAGEVPLLVVATARPELLERRPRWAGGKRNAQTVTLDALTDADTTRLLASLLERAILPGPLERELLERAGGNPLYLGEYVRMLADRGLVRREGEDRPLDASALAVPQSVRAVIAARLDTLEPQEKALLQDAAVLGDRFETAPLAALSGVAEAVVDERLLTLERKEFLRRDRGDGAGDRGWLFRHVLVRDVAYEQVARSRRGERHALAAAWLEAGGRVDDRAETIAHHYLNALRFRRRDDGDLPARARRALVAAGDRAARLDAFGAAARFYSEAIELTPEDDETAPDLLFAYGRALFFGRLEGEEAIRAARDAYLARGESERAAEAEVLLYSLRSARGDGESAAAHLDHAARLVDGAPPSRAKANVLGSRARFLMLAGEEQEAIRVGREALGMAEQLGRDDLRAHALMVVGTSRVTGGDAGGLDDVARSIEIASAINSAEVVRALRYLGAGYTLLGDLRRSFPYMADGRRAAERFGDAFNSRWLQAAHTTELYWTGRWEEAVAESGAFVGEAQAGSPHYMESVCRFVRGHVALARDDPVAALGDAAAALEVARASTDEWLVAPAIAFCARAGVAAGTTDTAVQLADELLRLVEERRPIASYWAADLAAALVELERGRDLLGAVAAIERPTRWLAAATAFVQGEYGRAADLYAEVGSRPDEAYARLRSGDPRELERALAFFREVGAGGYAGEAEALLRAA